MAAAAGIARRGAPCSAPPLPPLPPPTHTHRNTPCRYEIDKLTASQRLDLNLEKGRMRDELQMLRDKANELEIKVGALLSGRACACVLISFAHPSRSPRPDGQRNQLAQGCNGAVQERHRQVSAALECVCMCLCDCEWAGLQGHALRQHPDLPCACHTHKTTHDNPHTSRYVMGLVLALLTIGLGAARLLI